MASVLALLAMTMRQAKGSSAARKSCSRRIEPGSAPCSLWTGTTISTSGGAGGAAARTGLGMRAGEVMTATLGGLRENPLRCS